MNPQTMHHINPSAQYGTAIKNPILVKFILIYIYNIGTKNSFKI